MNGTSSAKHQVLLTHGKVWHYSDSIRVKHCFMFEFSYIEPLNS